MFTTASDIKRKSQQMSKVWMQEDEDVDGGGGVMRELLESVN